MCWFHRVSIYISLTNQVKKEQVERAKIAFLETKFWVQYGIYPKWSEQVTGQTILSQILTSNLFEYYATGLRLLSLLVFGSLTYPLLADNSDIWKQQLLTFLLPASGNNLRVLVCVSPV